MSGIGKTLTGIQFNWRRLITAEYGSAYIWLVAIILVTLKNIWLNGEYDSASTLVWSMRILFVVVTIAYVVARLLKKTGVLKSAPNSAS